MLPRMQTLSKSEIVGFVQLQVGSLAVQVPVRAVPEDATQPLATFQAEGKSFAIVIRGDRDSKGVEEAVNDAAEQAVRHLSRKLLN